MVVIYIQRERERERERERGGGLKTTQKKREKSGRQKEIRELKKKVKGLALLSANVSLNAVKYAVRKISSYLTILITRNNEIYFQKI